MTDPFSDLGDPTPVEPVVPNHRASTDAPLTGEPTRSKRLFELSGKRGTADKPARTRTQRPKTPPPPVNPGEFIEPLTDAYNLLAMTLMPFKPAVSMVIISPSREPTEDEREKDITPPTVAENCARCWDEVAQKNDSVRRTLKTAMTVGVWGALVMAHAPILAAVMSETKAGEQFSALFNPARGAEEYLKAQEEPSGE